MQLPADETDPQALKRALLAHTAEARRARERRPTSAPWNSLATLLLLGAGVAALLVFGGGPRSEELPGMGRRGPPAVTQRARTRGL